MAPLEDILNFTKTVHNDTYPFIDSTKANMQGKHVLVTGASGGIGKAVAISFARAGASGIAIAARRDLTTIAQEIEQATVDAGRSKPNVLIVNVDQTNQQSVEEAAKKVEQSFGQLDVLVNNAGYLEKWKPVGESDPEDWWRTWEVNVKGPYLMCRSFIPLMLKGGNKIIVSITSMGGVATIPSGSAYQGTKTVNIRFNNFLKAEYEDQGLLVYALHPGSVKTDMGSNLPAFMQHMLTDTPEMAADTVVWLTKERREWLQDRFINSAWDMEELQMKKDEIVQRDLLKFRMMT